MARTIRNKNIATTSGKNRMALATWLRQAFTEYPDRPVDDVHLDELVGPWEHGISDGVEWVRYSCSVLGEVLPAVLSEPPLSAVREILVALPLGSSERLRIWKSRFWHYAGMDYQPPSLYLIKAELFAIDRWDEEYFRRIDLPIVHCPGIKAVYRSSRRFEAGVPEDEFTNTIFLLASIKREQSH